MEVAQELGISYPKVVACVKEGLFRYIKEFVFIKKQCKQIRNFTCIDVFKPLTKFLYRERHKIIKQ